MTDDRPLPATRRYPPPVNKVGRTLDKGYWWVYQPAHPSARKNGYVKICRLVVEARLGRYLLAGEDVHHINRDELDDRDENLAVLPHAAHCRETSSRRRRNSRGQWENR